MVVALPLLKIFIYLNVYFHVAGLSSYTSKFANNDYQLGSFETTSSPKKPEVAKKEKESDLIIEDYLKPNADDTTWSNEQNADILF